MSRQKAARAGAGVRHPRRARLFRRRGGVVGVAALVVGATAAALVVPPIAAEASSHREAPLISGDPAVDNTDTYAFVSPDDPNTVTLVANWLPFQEPAGGPNFYPFSTDARYDINIDNNGDAKPDITYRWTFASSYRNQNTFLYNTGPVTSLDDPDLNFRQTYRLERISDGKSTVVADKVPVAPSYVGNASMPDYLALRTASLTQIPGGGKTFAGQADDPFFLDLRVFDLLYGGDLSEVGQDSLAGFNVNSIVLQVPKADLALRGDPARNPVIGVWSSTQRRSAALYGPTDGSGQQLSFGGWSQVSRLGAPLVNEVVVPLGQKDRFNASTPARDAQFLKFVTDPELPKLIQAIYKIPAPPTPRKDLVAVFLTGVSKDNLGVDLNAHALNADADRAKIAPSEQLRLNMSIPPTATPNRLGVLGGDTAGYPNGRRLGDDVVDISLQAVEGALLPKPPAAVTGLGDGVDGPDVRFRGWFPYVGLPTSGSS
ncbi:hypothetical protein CcI49_05520 [Frankia sp. CcI49]|uniref:DUF4331 domain-containing protein n=1 Tax=unclassified Frankia TaxID=2632575 RepID=UPI0006C9EA40|nr:MULTISPECIES: DUF4331 domain-containing protein [unclassified Frankia]KPM54231.1 hypothetical protein ACG83_19760 [Frankia sp. R43]ONH61658.1 hypothetical protein CcI49_05520 [Frankia sp. CcI49]